MWWFCGFAGVPAFVGFLRLRFIAGYFVLFVAVGKRVVLFGLIVVLLVVICLCVMVCLGWVFDLLKLLCFRLLVRLLFARFSCCR